MTYEQFSQNVNDRIRHGWSTHHPIAPALAETQERIAVLERGETIDPEDDRLIDVAPEDAESVQP